MRLTGRTRLDSPASVAEDVPMTNDQKSAAQQRFLESFARIGVVSRAAVDAGVSRRTVYNWLKSDGEFQDAFKQAEEEARDLIREEIHRRAIEGWHEPVYQRGSLVGQITKYSDALLMRMARARLPEYRDASPTSRANDAPAAESQPVIVSFVEIDNWRSVQRATG
jgi:AcrR family transcriptional regulator